MHPIERYVYPTTVLLLIALSAAWFVQIHRGVVKVLTPGYYDKRGLHLRARKSRTCEAVTNERTALPNVRVPCSPFVGFACLVHGHSLTSRERRAGPQCAIRNVLSSCERARVPANVPALSPVRATRSTVHLKLLALLLNYIYRRIGYSHR